MTQADLEALAKEPLDEELQACVYDGPLGPMIGHPLVHTLTVVSGLANKMLQYKREALAEAEADNNWSRWVFLHERPYRCDALLNVRTKGCRPDEFAAIAAEVWVDSENIPQYLNQWRFIFKSTGGHWWMDAGERECLAGLPDQFVVYRGECEDGGFSWTLSFDVAKFFATRGTNNSTDVITKGVVRKRDVFAYLGRRSEEEVLVTNRKLVSGQRVCWTLGKGRIDGE